MVASRRTVVGSGVLGAVIGALVTWTLISPSTPPGEVPDAPGVSEARPGAVEAPQAKADATTVATTLLDRAPTATSIGEIDPAAAAKVLLDAAVVTLPPLVSGTITGRVETVDGQPVAGAVVQAQAYSPTQRVGPPGTAPSPVESIQQAAAHAKWSATTAREAVTDASGAYVLDGLRDVQYWLRSQADGYEVRLPPTVRSNTVRPGDALDFVATPVAWMVVSVLRPDGSSATEAEVRWTSPTKGGGSGTAWRSDSPRVAMPPGTWSVFADIGDEMRSPPVVVEVGGEADPVVLRLEVRNSIVGKLRIDPSDSGWWSAFLIAKRHGGPEGDRPHQTDARPPDWSFRFADLPAGDYEVSAGFTEGAPIASASVRVGTGVANVALAVPRLTSAEVLEVRAVGPDGTLLGKDDVRLSIMVRGGGRASGRGARVGHRADGTLMVALEDPDAAMRQNASLRGLPAPAPSSDHGQARWSLVATWKGQSKEVEFDFGRTVRVDLRFE